VTQTDLKKRGILMQLTLEIPDDLGHKLNAMPNPQQFIVKFLSEFLNSGLNQDQWWLLLDEIDEIAVDTGLTDLSERHDDYLGRLE
jgi:hypothetical protein